MSLEDDTIAEAPSTETLARFALNDWGNAMRLIALCGGRFDGPVVDTADCTLLFLMGQGWIGFNGKHWDLKFGETLARRMAHQVHLKMNNADMKAHIMQAHALDPVKTRAFVDGLGDSGKTSAMLKQAESYLTVEIDDFDNHPMAVNCRNFTLWLKADAEKGVKITKKAHHPADRITRMVHCDFDPNAKAALFEAVAEKSLPEPGLRAFFQRALGYTLTGYTYERALFMCQGKGSDGKSTMLNAVREMMGGYGEAGKNESFLDTGQTNASSASPDIVKLAGDVRMVTLSEPARGAKLAEGRIKEWTGGEPISTRQLQGKMFDFKPKGRLWWMCNALPVVRGDDDGIWNRTHILLFQHQMAERDQDKKLPEKLAGEHSGILNWMLAGVGDWLTQGLAPPEIVAKAKEDYRKQSSPFGDWLNECCVWGDAAAGHRTLTTELYKSYKDWMIDQGGDEKPMSLRSFGDALFQRQILHGPRMNDGKKTRAPIRLKTTEERDLAAKASGASQASPASATVGVADISDDPFADLPG
jgi:putative DNA primase/helicase